MKERRDDTVGQLRQSLLRRVLDSSSPSQSAYLEPIEFLRDLGLGLALGKLALGI